MANYGGQVPSIFTRFRFSYRVCHGTQLANPNSKSQLIRAINYRVLLFVLVGIESQVVNMINIGGMSWSQLGLRLLHLMVNMRWHVSVLVLVGFETQVVNMVNMGGGRVQVHDGWRSVDCLAFRCSPNPTLLCSLVLVLVLCSSLKTDKSSVDLMWGQLRVVSRGQ